MIKFGIGYDIHPLEKGSKLIIGGLEIRSEFSSKGHSDGDALTHAIIDALLGAVNRGDIGQYFSSDENKWKGAKSLDLLSIVRGEIISLGYELNHIDTVVILQKPFIKTYVSEIQKSLSDILKTDKTNISIKATTTDHLGFIGESKGWGAMAIVSLCKME